MDRTSPSLQNRFHLIILFLLFLYLFLLSIQLMGGAFKLFGEGFAETLLSTTADPFTGLFLGLLVTSLTQSSSLTTSVTVGLVAGGVLNLHNAIPIIMGANIGTTVTNIIVSLGHISRREEFRRAFAASLVHDIFNLLSVIIIFPLEYFTNYLEKLSLFLTGTFSDTGGLKFVSPLKAITSPVAKSISGLVERNFEKHEYAAAVVLGVALVLLFISLRYMVRYMKALIMTRAEVIFEQTVFKTPLLGLTFGMLLTALVQSSSVTTSLIVPLAGAGLLTLDRVFPYTLGANIGTTITAILAAMAAGTTSGVAVAFSHLMFNISGIAIFWWIQFVPIKLAHIIAYVATKNRFLAVFYVILINVIDK